MMDLNKFITSVRKRFQEVSESLLEMFVTNNYNNLALPIYYRTYTDMLQRLLNAQPGKAKEDFFKILDLN